jgi:hypothetical protein
MSSASPSDNTTGNHLFTHNSSDMAQKALNSTVDRDSQNEIPMNLLPAGN